MNPNYARELSEKEEKRLLKVKAVDDIAMCSCMERFNTGLPC